MRAVSDPTVDDSGSSVAERSGDEGGGVSELDGMLIDKAGSRRARFEGRGLMSSSLLMVVVGEQETRSSGSRRP